MKIQRKLASSGSLTGMKALIAEFYATGPDRIVLVDSGTHWTVQSGVKTVTPVVVKQGARFVFGVPESGAGRGARCSCPPGR